MLNEMLDFCQQEFMEDPNEKRRIGYSIINGSLKDIKPGYFCFFVYKKGFFEEFESIKKDIIELLYLSSVII